MRLTVGDVTPEFTERQVAARNREALRRLRFDGESPIGSLRRLVAVTWAIVAGMMALYASSAFASNHPFEGRFGSFSHPSGIGVDEASENVFVADGGSNNVVDIFGPLGGPPSGVGVAQIGGFAFGGEPSGVAIDNSAGPVQGDLYAADVSHNAVKKFALNSTTEEYELVEALSASPGFSEPLGVGVNSRGDVFVADWGHETIVEFGPSGNEIERINVSSPVGNPSAVALDSKGDLFVQSYSNSSIYKYAANASGEIEMGTVPTLIEQGGATGVGVDTATDTLYVPLRDHVGEYDALTGAFEGEFGAGQLTRTERLAVNAASGRIYVVDSGAGNVVVFGPEPTAGPPVILGETTVAVGLNDATVEAKVNPNFSATTCEVEYVDAVHYDPAAPDPYGAGQTAPCSPADLGASGGSGNAVAATARLTGLRSAGTTYHWRVVATNSIGAADGPDHTFTTPAEPPSFGLCPNQQFRAGFGNDLPDCRAYEQVTPAGAIKLNNVIPFIDLTQASPDGKALTVFTNGGIPGGAGAQDYPLFLARRGPDQWSTEGLYPPPSYGPAAGILGWDRDLGQVFVFARRFGGGPGLFARKSSDGSIEMAVPYQAGLRNQGYYLAATSAGGTRVLFETSFEGSAPLLPGASAEGPNLYLLDRETGALSLAGALDSGQAPTGGAVAGPSGGAQFGYYTEDSNAISRDGTRVFFTGAATGQVYLREDPAGPGAHTIELSAPEAGVVDPNGEKPATFVSATPDGSLALFTSPGKLTADATTGPADEGNDLYRYDVVAGRLSDLTVDAADPAGAEVLGVLGSSDDGAYIYFAANGVLAPGATLGDCSESPSRGSCNLYLWHAGTTSFIARLDNAGGIEEYDGANWQPRDGRESTSRERTSRLTPNGRILVIRSQGQLTSFENQGVPEFYRYDAADGALTCVSCNPTGSRPVATPALQDDLGVVGSAAKSAATVTHNLSEDGRRFFFDTPEPLVADDTNGVTDVYEWEAPGSGTCDQSTPAYSPLNGGCLYLLSSGSDPSPSYFADAGASGDDAFFFTAQSLVGQDGDGGVVDAYDARVGGGLAAQQAPLESACSGDACKGNGTSSSPLGIPASSLFHGKGNQPRRHGCSGQGRRVKRLSRRVKLLRREARLTRSAQRAVRVRREAYRLARRVRALSDRARRCGQGSSPRRSGKRGGRSRSQMRHTTPVEHLAARMWPVPR